MRLMQQIKIRQICEGHFDQEIIERIYREKPKADEFEVLCELLEGVKMGLFTINKDLTFKLTEKGMTYDFKKGK